MESSTRRVIIVTGGASGIGKGIATAFAEQEHIVVIVDVDETKGLETIAELASDHNDRCFFIATDVANSGQVRNTVEWVFQKFGHIDVLVNNAGIVLFKSLLDVSEAEWDQLLNTDLKGAFLCTKAVLPYMIRQKRGVVINIASNHAFATLPDSEVYAAAKGGLVSFTRSLSQSFGHQGIRAVAICPGFTDTPHMRRWLSSSQDPLALESYITSLHPAGRIATPLDIGRLAVFLASDNAAMITGTSVVIDGGLLSRLYH
jgi:NAD(P)-dependent dehydrogenase (short-subunit alcohol dehydrogenase family)